MKEVVEFNDDFLIGPDNELNQYSDANKEFPYYKYKENKKRKIYQAFEDSSEGEEEENDTLKSANAATDVLELTRKKLSLQNTTLSKQKKVSNKGDKTSVTEN